MASFAHLSREERLGLGIAAAAHVALGLALYFQTQDEPTALPTPERMTVSLASEVSLQSASPNPSAEAQAAIAPVLAPEPAPAPEPVPAPDPVPTQAPKPEPRPVPQPTRTVTRPTPAPQPTARPTAKPKPAPSPSAKPTAQPKPSPSAKPSAQPTKRPTPTPTQTRSGGGSRIGADFLEGTSGGERTNSRGTPAATFGAAEAASLMQAISREIKPHWSAPQGVDAEKLVTVLSFELNPDGSLKGTPRVVSQSGITDSNRPQASLHAERAIRAVQLAAPFDLPDEFYDKWKRVSQLRFDRRL